MKKNYTTKMFGVFLLILGLMVTGLTLHAQDFSEDFENGFPEYFFMKNLDGLTPDDPDLIGLADSAWSIRYITQDNMNSICGFTVSWFQNDEGPADRWMITPALDLGDNSILSWDGLAITSSGLYRDLYMVLISTSDTSVAAFNENLPLFDTGPDGEEVTIQNRSVNLAELGYQNQTVYIAWRDYTPPYVPGVTQGGNELAIDNILVTEAGVSGLNQIMPEAVFTVYPNPVQSTLNIANIEEYTECSVFNLLGEEVRTLLLNRNSQIAIDVNDMPNGVYFVSLTASTGEVTTKRFIKE